MAAPCSESVKSLLAVAATFVGAAASQPAAHFEPLPDVWRERKAESAMVAYDYSAAPVQVHIAFESPVGS